MEQKITIVNRLGLHARAAAKLVTLASRYHSDIQLKTTLRTVSGKSIMGVLMLAAAQGTELTISADGGDAPEALEAIAALVADCFGEKA